MNPSNPLRLFDLVKRELHNLRSDQKFSEIFTGSIWSFSAHFLTVGLGLLINIIIARAYGADVIGILAIINSFLHLAELFTVLGTGTSILRLIPEHLVKYSPTSAFRLYRKTQYMVIGISVMTGALFFFCSGFIAGKVFSKQYLTFYFALSSAFLVFKSITALNTHAVRGLGLIKTFALMQALPFASNLILLLALGLLFFTKDIPVYAVLGSFAVTGIAGWVIMEFTFKRRMTPEDQIHVISRKEILSISIPMFMTGTMAFVINQTGVIMLGMFRSDAEVGYYAIAVKLATLTVFILQAINSMAAPKFSEFYHSNKIDDLFYVAKKSTKLIFWTTAPILAGLVVLGKPILGLLFGSGFTVAYGAMVLLVIGQFVNSISGSTGYFMNMTGNERVLQYIVCIAAVINIGLNLLLIPVLGIIGSALAAMISTSFWNIGTLIFIKLKFGKTIGWFPLCG